MELWPLWMGEKVKESVTLVDILTATSLVLMEVKIPGGTSQYETGRTYDTSLE